MLYDNIPISNLLNSCILVKISINWRTKYEIEDFSA